MESSSTKTEEHTEPNAHPHTRPVMLSIDAIEAAEKPIWQQAWIWILLTAVIICMGYMLVLIWRGLQPPDPTAGLNFANAPNSAAPVVLTFANLQNIAIAALIFAIAVGALLFWMSRRVGGRDAIEQELNTREKDITDLQKQLSLLAFVADPTEASTSAPTPLETLSTETPTQTAKPSSAN